MNVACTIFDADYLHYALALNESLQQHGNTLLYMLVMGNTIDKDKLTAEFPNLRVLYLDDIANNKVIIEMIVKYINTDVQALRWGLKPFLMHYLLEKHERVFWFDSDLFFFNDYQFLFDELKENNILLAPHWRNITPNHSEKREQINFDLLFTDGLFNAGMVGASQAGKEAVWWWATACAANCELNKDKGLFADQMYLSVLPIYFPKVKILRHLGCNVAEWNLLLCKRTLGQQGEVLINNEFPIVFTHCTSGWVRQIQDGTDALLQQHATTFLQTLEKYKPYSKPYKEQKEKLLAAKNAQPKTKLQLFKEFLRPKTRIKRFLEG
jgi:hypothetical protein